ncbi:MAG: universal stress protein [Desulfobacteraceae bacterium]|nr:MAG: universal stress protein [Desulfobacteraceae bacterium]
MSRTTKKVLIAILLLLISYVHYRTHAYHSVLHVVHRELYLVPILFAAYWFGKKGGLTIAGVSSLMFLPKILTVEGASSAYGINNLLEIMTFFIVAYLLGHYQDVRHSHWRSFFRSARPTTREVPQKYGSKVMVCFDNSPNARKAIQYVVDTFLKLENTEVSVLGFIRDPSGDAFPSQEQYRNARAENERTVVGLVDEARRMLLDGGFIEHAISTGTVRIQRESLASRIIEEQRRLSCDTVIMPGTRMSKTEELILGNPAVKLVREADFTIVTVY